MAKVVLGLSLVLVLSSCIGMDSDITIRQDGSGTITQEYRISRSLESLGKLDGNARQPAIPLGKADFERSVARVQGMKMTSYTEKATERDTIYRITLEFTALDALVHYLDAAGGGASLARENGKRRLSLSLGGGEKLDPDLAAFTRESMEGYAIKLGFSLPSEAGISFSGERGRVFEAPPVGEAVVKGGKAVYQAAVGDLLSREEPLVMEIRW